MGLIIISAIYQGSESPCHLHHCYRLCLSKTAGGKLHWIQLPLRVDQSCRLSRQIDTRLLPKAVELIVFIKSLPPKLLADGHQRGVARFHQAVAQIQSAVAGSITAMNVPVGHLNHSITGKSRIFIVQILVQGCRNRKGLKGRSRLIGRSNAEVCPHVQSVFRLFLIWHCSDLRLRIHTAKISRIIQVKGGVRRHGKNLSIFNVGKHYRHTLCPHSLLLKFCDFLFHDPLGVGINGKDNGIAVFRRLYCALQFHVRTKVSVFPSRRTAQFVIIAFFHTIIPLILRRHKTN